MTDPTQQNVPAFSTTQYVCACLAIQHVILPISVENIISAVACEMIGKGRTPDIFNAGNHVSLGMATRDGVGCQVSADPCIRFPVIQRIKTVAPVNDIGPGTACQRVVAGLAAQPVNIFPATQVIIATAAYQGIRPRPTEESISTAITGQDIVKRRSPDILDCADDITPGMTAGSRASGQVHPDAGIGTAIIQGVKTFAPVYHVRARSSPDQVVAGVADQRIGVRAAVQVVTDINPPVGQQYDHHRQGKPKDQQVGNGNQWFHQLCPAW